MKRRAWWNNLELCRAKKKNGFYCNNYIRKPYEIEPGNLFIPLTCWRHKNQEKELRKKLIK